MRRMRYTLLGFACDKPGCEALLDVADEPHAYGHEGEAKLLASGWTVWAGRGQPHYCPEHTPINPGKMRKVDLRRYVEAAQR